MRAFPVIRLIAITLCALAAALTAVPASAQAPATPAPAAGATRATAQPEAKPATAPPTATPPPAAPAPAPEVLEIQNSVKGIVAGIEKAERTINDVKEHEDGLARLRGDVENILADSTRIADDMRPRLDDVKSQIDKLGPPPKDGPEGDAVAAERTRLNALSNALGSAIKTTELTWVRARQLIERITDLRHALFTKNLMQQLPSPLLPALWKDLYRDTPTVVSQLSYLWQDWVTSASARGGIVGVLLIGSTLLYLVMRQALLRVVKARRHRNDSEPPSFFERATSVTWVAPLRAAPGIFAALLVYGGLDALDLLYFPSDHVMSAALKAVVIFSAMAAIVLAVLSPREAEWRLFDVDNAAARRVATYLEAIIGIFAFDLALAEVNRWLLIPLSVSVVQTLVANMLVAALVAAVLLTRLHHDDCPPPTRILDRLRPVWLKLPLLAMACGIVGATLTGYIALGRFMAQQLVMTGLVIVVSWLLYLAIRVFTREPMEAGLPVSEILETTFGLDAAKREALAKLTEFLLTMLLVAVAIPFVLLQWGFAAADIRDWFQSLFFGFEVGQFKISLARILIGIVLFVALVLATRLFQRWLKETMLRPSHLDGGIVHSIDTVIGYAGTVIAALLAVSYAGFDITNLAIVAGALSVGIGFGLQSIVNNFVSGLILLIERPVKVGDWIVVGGEEGYVRKISVRSTEIETFDRSSVIIPNADLITGKVKNWTLRDAVGRMKISINVAMDADLEMVRNMLIKIATAHRGVLQYPKPFVTIEAFTDNAATMSLNVFVGDVNQGGMVRTDLAIAMLTQLRQANVKTPNFDPTPPFPPAPGQAAGPALDGAALLSLTLVVGLDADPDVARTLMIGIATAHPGVGTPPPSVVFDGFGDGGVKLTLRAVIKDASRMDEIRTQLAFAAIKAMRAAGVPTASAEHHVKLADLEPFRKALSKAMEERARSRSAEDAVST